jgi:hypothetical protein
MENTPITNNMDQDGPPNSRQKLGRLSSLTKSHISLFVKGLMYSGIGYLVIGLFSYLLWYVINKNVHITNQDSSFTIILIVSIVVMLVSSIMGMVATFKLARGTLKFGFMMSIYIIYIIAQILAFSALFWCFTQNYATNQKGIQYLLLIFAGGGLAFVISALIAKAMSKNAVIKFSRFVGYLSIGFLVVLLLSVIINVVLIVTKQIQASYILYTSLISVSIVVFFIYLIYDMSMLSKVQEIFNIEDNQQQANVLAMFFGYRILVDLIALV